MVEIIESIFQAFINGVGSGLGTYFAFKYGIDHLERIPLVKDKVRQYIEGDSIKRKEK